MHKIKIIYIYIQNNIYQFIFIEYFFKKTIFIFNYSMKVIKKCTNKVFKSVDFFGIPISMRYKGD